MHSGARLAFLNDAMRWGQVFSAGPAAPAADPKSHPDNQFQSVANATPAAMAGHAVNTTIALVALLPIAPLPELLVWAAYSYAICAYVFLRRARAPSIEMKPAPSARMERRAQGFAVLLALPWLFLSLRYLGSITQPAETIVISLGVGMAASGAILLSPMKRAAVTYMTVILLPTVFKCLLVIGTAQYVQLGLLGVSYWVFLFALIATTNKLFFDRQNTVRQLQLALAETTAAREENERIALCDELTGLANRRAFMQRLTSGFAGGAAPPLALFFLDLDRFKALNDSFGHRFGDLLLGQVAERLTYCVPPDGMVARLGGDEFAVIVADVSDQDLAGRFAERLVARISEPFLVQDQSVIIGVSVGVALADPGRDSAEQVVKRADIAMYEAKACGRNGYRIFEEEMQDRIGNKRNMEYGLRRALSRSEFELYFQPIYDLKTLQVHRFEALLRWHHPERGLIGPGEFLPVADEIGLAGSIGSWVVRQACMTAASWPDDIGLAVNLSPLQIDDPGFVPQVRAVLARSGFPARRLELEITETALLTKSDQVMSRLSELKAMGISLSMDDFGTGYSSLSYLAQFPLDGLKVDKGFIAAYATLGESAEIIRAMVGLAKALRRTSTIEGIETLQQLLAAQSLGAEYGQGYFLGLPGTAAEVASQLEVSFDPICYDTHEPAAVSA